MNDENIMPHRWKPGQSGNPSGRPKGRSAKGIKEALMNNLEDHPELLNALAKKAIKYALAGNFNYWRAIFEIVEGKIGTVEPEVIDWTALNNEGDTPRPIGRFRVDYSTMPEPEPEDCPEELVARLKAARDQRSQETEQSSDQGEQGVD